MSSPIRNSSEEQFSVATAEVAALTLANLCFDVQIGICMCLHPSDIMALRKVCHGRHLSESFTQTSEVFLSRLAKLFNSALGNGWFGWLRFIEYA
jgi:hypothetical protein